MNPVVTDIIGEVIQKVSAKVFTDPAYAAVKTAIEQQLSTSVKEITYMHGHPIEIIGTLSQRDGTDNELKFKKYPLFALFQDFSEQPVAGGFEANLQLIIATSTQQELKADQRYAITFRPILYPLHELFFSELNKHKKVISFYRADYQKYDRVFWGTVGDLMAGTQVRLFNDYLDAIELQNLKVKFYNNNC